MLNSCDTLWFVYTKDQNEKIGETICYSKQILQYHTHTRLKKCGKVGVSSKGKTHTNKRLVYQIST